MRHHRPTLPMALFFALFFLGPTSAKTAGASGSERLRRDVVPTFESISLNLDARKPGYTGSVRIDLRVDAATDSFQLNSEGLTLGRLTLRGAKGIVPSTHRAAGPAAVALRTRSPLKPGAYTLHIDFANTFNTRAQGIYRLETGGEWYCFTQFESDDARKAFPCWDEPSFKIPYQLTLAVPRGHRALTNTPVAHVTPGKVTKTVMFRRTKPLPSYLLAIAAGPLEMVPITGMSVPGNVVCVKGASALAGTASTMAPRLLGALERYFGRPYPYEKLDVIAVPEFWPGAMENAGLVTFRDDVLLVEPKTVSVRQLSRLSVYMAHEFAHMWFGDLVTMEWWDDLWLNEAFAEWMGNKISDEVYPEYKMHVQDLQATQGAMKIDARLSTRAIRQPVSALDNLLQAADELAYKKGQAVLGMFEQWLGPDKFRAGVLDYLNAHEWGNAVGSDLWSALSKASGKDASGPMSTFLDQGGVPLVTAEIQPDGRVRLSQRRFLSYGAQAAGDPLWKIPVALTYSDGLAVRTKRFLLSEREATVELEGDRAPIWVNPNAGAAGYYRWTLSPEAMQKLAQSAAEIMSPAERVGYLGNLTALLDAGLLHGDEYVRLLARFADDPSPEVLSALADGVDQVRRVFVTPELAEPFAVYVRQTLGPALGRLGLTRRPGEEDGVSLVRPELVHMLGDYGKDDRILAFADSLAKQYIAASGSVDPSLAGVALDLSALHADAALFAEYKRRFETARVPADRSRFLAALGFFRDPKIVEEALRYSLQGPLRPQEIFTIPNVVGLAVEYEEIPYRWMTENFGAISTKIPPMFSVFMPQFASGCSVKRLEAAKSFFAEPSRSVPGADKELAKIADQVNDCAGLREREGAVVTAYLGRLAGAR